MSTTRIPLDLMTVHCRPRRRCSFVRIQRPAADAAKLMDRIGPSVALTNSAGGMRALLTALKTSNIAGIVMYENVPEASLKGNTHTPFADMNNVAVADLLSKFLAENGL